MFEVAGQQNISDPGVGVGCFQAPLNVGGRSSQLFSLSEDDPVR